MRRRHGEGPREGGLGGGGVRRDGALRRADEFATTAREWSALGNRLYTAQIVAAASVPVRAVGS